MGGLGKFIAGKPVFEEPQAAGAPTPQPAGQPAAKSFPQVVIGQLKCDESGSDMICTAVIRNMSAEEVFLDKVRLLGTVKELDATLRAGDSKEFYAVYKGSKPQHDSYSEAQLEYRTMPGDYLMTAHFVEYSYEAATRTYTPRRIRFLPPVRDI